MTCPKCEEGRLIKVKLKKDQSIAFLCDFCDAIWFDGEVIKDTSGHTFRSFTQGDALEYTIEESEEKDQEHRSAKYVENK